VVVLLLPATMCDNRVGVRGCTWRPGRATVQRPIRGTGRNHGRAPTAAFDRTIRTVITGRCDWLPALSTLVADVGRRGARLWRPGGTHIEQGPRGCAIEGRRDANRHQPHFCTAATALSSLSSVSAPQLICWWRIPHWLSLSWLCCVNCSATCLTCWRGIWRKPILQGWRGWMLRLWSPRCQRGQRATACLCSCQRFVRSLDTTPRCAPSLLINVLLPYRVEAVMMIFSGRWSGAGVKAHRRDERCARCQSN